MLNIFQFHVKLNESHPVIWRRIQVERNATFLDLHIAIQLAMGWTNSHLFNFRLERVIIELPTEEGTYFDTIIPEEGRKLNASVERIEDYFKEAGDEMVYHYDFGDDWEHTVVLEKAMSAQKGMKYPYCVGGALNCPHEDSGGIYGFYEKLEIIGDKEHPDYDPFVFDIDDANKKLANASLYLKEMFE